MLVAPRSHAQGCSAGSAPTHSPASRSIRSEDASSARLQPVCPRPQNGAPMQSSHFPASRRTLSKLAERCDSKQVDRRGQPPRHEVDGSAMLDRGWGAISRQLSAFSQIKSSSACSKVLASMQFVFGAWHSWSCSETHSEIAYEHFRLIR